MTFRDKVQSVLQFIKILRVEPYVFLMIFQFGLKITPDNQMIQDKICSQWYNTTPSYCHDLPSLKETDSDLGHYKSRILSDSAQFGAYKTYIVTIPQIIWALFIGAWLDRYQGARKWILLIFSICSIIEDLISIYLTISWETSVYANLSVSILTLLLVGGESGPRIAVLHYMTTTTPPDLMAIRFMIFQLCFTLAIPVGQTLGGYVLVQEPTFNTGQIRNFTMCHIIALVFEVLAIFLIIFMIDEKVAQKQELEIHEMSAKKEIDQGVVAISKRNNNNLSKEKHPIKMLFDLENIRLMARTLIKKRPNKARKQLILLIFSLGIIFGEQIGMMVLNSQFIQKVYLWTPDWISYMSSISMLIFSFCTLLIIPIASKLLNVADIPLALFGYLLILICSIIKGIWLDPGAFYVTMIISSFCGTASICSKSHLAKIVDRDELGRVMSFLTALDSVTPIIFVTLLIQIFKLTIDTYPGTVYLVVATLILIPIFTTVWIHFFTDRPLERKQNDHGHVENQKDDSIHSKF